MFQTFPPYDNNNKNIKKNNSKNNKMKATTTKLNALRSNKWNALYN